jgi:peroxiredoxin Q/BCP
MNPLTHLLSALSIGYSAASAVAEPLAVGAALPAVAQINQDGQSVKLAAAGAAGYLLVYFYPKADTPGCTKQACSLRDSYAELTKKGLGILGVSTDSVKAQKAFKDKYRLPVDLLADEDATVLTAFGVPRTLGFAKRQAFLFKDGKLVWRDLAAAPAQQAAEVLSVLAANP